MELHLQHSALQLLEARQQLSVLLLLALQLRAISAATFSTAAGQLRRQLVSLLLDGRELAG
jgi:hypothetical protein